MNSELECILKAAERHPNNYYAWQHARRVLSAKDKVAVGNDVDLEAVLRAVLNRVLQWCLQNPSDTSGWSFLLHILAQPGMQPADTAAVLNSVLNFATQLKWRKEALWVFVRAALGSAKATANECREAQLVVVRQLATQPGVQIPYFGEANPCCAGPQDSYWADVDCSNG
jgi:hypothetical protein